MATEYTLDVGGMDAFPGAWSTKYAGAATAEPFVGAVGSFVRGGIIPAVGASGRYQLSAGMVGTFKACRYLLPMTDPARGAQVFRVDADLPLTHATAHASQPRTDLIIAEFKDDGTTASSRKIRILTGTAGSGAPAPALPTDLGLGNAAVIASVNIPANATTLGTITQTNSFTCAAGGELYLPGAMALSAGSRQALAATLPTGQRWLDDLASPVALGFTRAGDLCPTNVRKVATATRNTPADIAGSNPATNTILAVTANLFGGVRAVEIHVTANIFGQSAGGSARLVLDGSTLGGGMVSDWMQGNAVGTGGAGRVAMHGSFYAEVSGTQTWTLRGIVEGSASTIRVGDVGAATNLYVFDRGPV